jgi:hypothetical protein
MTVAERLAAVERLLADPPVVHPMDPSGDPAMGVWSTEPDCYRFIARRCDDTTRTLETGAGLSTALFAAIGTHHTCVTPGRPEVERLQAYFDSRGIDGSRVAFDVAPSHVSLPRGSGELDLVLIDGGHGFPMPILDWFYAGERLRPGGVLIVDDLPLPAVRTLMAYVDRDDRWQPLERTEKWAAFERRSSGSLAEDWTQQPFYVVHPPGAKAFVHRVMNKARREARRVLGG